MAIAQNSFQFAKGEDAQITWTIQQSSTNTAPVDITNWTFDLKVKRSDADVDPSVIVPTHTILVPASGTVKSVFAAAGMLVLSGDYVYSFWRTNVGALTCLSKGYFSVLDTSQS